MRGYFKVLADAFPYRELDRLYYKHVTESLGSDMDEFIDPFLGAFNISFTAQINGHLYLIYIEGSAEMISWGKTKAGLPMVYEGPPMQQAISYASKRAGWLIKGMDRETIGRLKTVIADGIANKRGVSSITSALRKEFETMSRYRAQMIARTETADALGEAFMDRAREMKIEGKEWVWPGGECGICAANEGDGVIPLEDTFSSGDMHPPAHPHCRCALAPAMLK